MSSGYKTGIAFVVILFFVSGWLGYLDGCERGRAQGRAEQEAFDHVNALKIENRCREVPEPCVIMRQDTYDMLMERAITYGGGAPKPHKAAPKAKAEYGCWRYLSTGKCIDGDPPTREKQPALPPSSTGYLWHDTDGRYKIMHSDGDVQVCPFTELSDCMNWVATADWTTIH